MTGRFKAAAIVTCVAAMLLCSAAPAGSIYAKASRRSRSLFTDDTAKAMGDVLTILIEEQSTIANETSRKTNKKDDRSASVTGISDLMKAIDGATGKLFSIEGAKLNSTAETGFDGSADYGSSRTVTDRITVTVQDVLPNGTLVVLGVRTRKTAGDTQTVRVSGIVRPSDISQDNTISSKQVADFSIDYATAGQESQSTNPGWLGRILNFLNPF